MMMLMVSTMCKQSPPTLSSNSFVSVPAAVTSPEVVSTVLYCIYLSTIHLNSSCVYVCVTININGYRVDLRITIE